MQAVPGPAESGAVLTSFRPCESLLHPSPTAKSRVVGERTTLPTERPEIHQGAHGPHERVHRPPVVVRCGFCDRGTSTHAERADLGSESSDGRATPGAEIGPSCQTRRPRGPKPSPHPHWVSRTHARRSVCSPVTSGSLHGQDCALSTASDFGSLEGGVASSPKDELLAMSSQTLWGQGPLALCCGIPPIRSLEKHHVPLCHAASQSAQDDVVRMLHAGPSPRSSALQAAGCGRGTAEIRAISRAPSRFEASSVVCWCRQAPC